MVEKIQTYILMHREIPAAGIRLDSETASVCAVEGVHPFGLISHGR